VEPGVGSERAAALAGQLREAAAALIDLVHGIDPDRWAHVPAPGVWSIGKEVEHVAEGAAYQQWIVRMTLGQKVSSRRPSVERKQLTTPLSPRELAALFRERVDESARLVESLADEQLALPTRPPRATEQALAESIERILIGHIHTHHRDIELKLRASRRHPTGPT
jgi:uncharacterized damage-inducible protein DinB